jgi:hypothetical protein
MAPPYESERHRRYANFRLTRVEKTSVRDVRDERQIEPYVILVVVYDCSGPIADLRTEASHVRFRARCPRSERSAVAPVAVVYPSRADVRCWCKPVEDARRCRDAAFALIHFAPAEAYPLSATC